MFAPSSDYNNDLNSIIYDLQTMDRPGSKGYDGGDYTTDFGATSAAAPQVAAVAALMLSVNPSLTALEVENIMKSSGKSHLGYSIPCLTGPPFCPDLSSRKIVQACESVVEAINRNLTISGNIGANNSQITLYGHAGG